MFGQYWEWNWSRHKNLLRQVKRVKIWGMPGKKWKLLHINVPLLEHDIGGISGELTSALVCVSFIINEWFHNGNRSGWKFLFFLQAFTFLAKIKLCQNLTFFGWENIWKCSFVRRETRLKMRKRTNSEAMQRQLTNDPFF